MADVTFTVDGDTTNMVVNAKKGETAYKKVGAAIGGAGQQMDQFGKKAADAGNAASTAFIKTAMNVGRVVAAARAAAQAVRAIGQSMQQSLEKAAARSEEKGGAHLRASQAAREAGFNPEVASSFISKVDAASEGDKASLMESIAKNGGIDQARAGELFSALGSGAFSLSQVTSAVDSGEKLDVQAGLAGLSKKARAEIETRTQVNAINARAGMFSGVETRVGKALGEAEDRADPGNAALRAIIQDKTTGDVSKESWALAIDALRAAEQLARSAEEADTAKAINTVERDFFK